MAKHEVVRIKEPAVADPGFFEGGEYPGQCLSLQEQSYVEIG